MDAEFLAEWERVRTLVCDEACTLLREIEPSGKLATYASGLRGYFKLPFLCAWHAPDAELRAKIAAVVAFHIVGIKLLDDLIDADTDVDSCSLGCGSLRLIAEAEARIEALDLDNDLRAMLHDEMAAFARGWNRSEIAPATDLASWWDHVSFYGGGLMRTYARLGVLLSGQPGLRAAADRFFFAYGMVITVADDLVDYVPGGDRSGNLGHLIDIGAVPPEQVARLLQRLRRICVNAMRHHPRTAEFTALGIAFADDTEHRILPLHLKRIAHAAAA